MAVTVKEVESFENFGKCVEISNGIIEALVSIDVGPRVIKFNRVGGVNIMFTDINRDHHNEGAHYDEFYYKGAQWNIYGGHRLWAAPESAPETAYPDNNPVEYKVCENGAVFTPPVQRETGFAMQMELVMSENTPEMMVHHKITNVSGKEKEFAVWALSVLAAGGTEIIPQNTHDTGLLPNRTVAMWPYCDFADERLYLGHDYVTLRQDKHFGAFKMGFDAAKGLGYYVIGDTIFKKKYSPNHPNGNYADYGCSFETYTNELFLELETLGELLKVPQGETLVHTEEWSLFKNSGDFNAKSDVSIGEFLSKVK